MKFDKVISVIARRGGAFWEQPLFILTILVIGLSGIIAQVLILRELLVSFYGNELILGIILANWVILEASGVYLAGKAIDKIKNKTKIRWI